MTTRHAIYDPEGGSWLEAIVDSPAACPCRHCRPDAKDLETAQYWAPNPHECLLRCSWAIEFDPHAGLTAWCERESGEPCSRVELDREGCIARWGLKFIEAIEAIEDPLYWEEHPDAEYSEDEIAAAHSARRSGIDSESLEYALEAYGLSLPVDTAQAERRRKAAHRVEARLVAEGIEAIR